LTVRKRSVMTSLDQAAAVLFGLALGDAIGCPTEFMTLEQIKAKYGRRGIPEPPAPALFTDDTQMTLALTEGLLEAGLDADLDAQMQSVGQHFTAWLHSPENNRAPGNTCLAGVRRYESGIPWRESGIAASKGCGSAMRVATVGYFYQGDPQRLRETAHASGVITHRHPTAVAASIAAAYLVKLALDGAPTRDYIPLTMHFTAEMSDEFDAALYRVGHAGAWNDEEAALRHIGEGWTGEEAVALAIYCVLRYPDDYAACMQRAATTNGDSDSIACIAGGIMGARLGLDAIPAAWRERCEKAEALNNLAARMAAARGIQA
jgi:ADP-ribosylglycohydrolase